MASIDKGVHIDFRACAPVLSIAAGSAATGADTTVSNVALGRHALELYYGAASSDIGFTRNTLGLVIPNDNTDNEGIELGCGIIANADMPGHFKVGTDGAFYAELKFNIPDVSDYDVASFGFRKAAAYAAVGDLDTPAEVITAYSDLGGFNVNAGNIYSVTRLNTGVGVATDTTDNWADGESHTLKVSVSAAGVLSLLIDGAAPTVNTNELTFDDGDILIPFFRPTKGANAADTPPIIEQLHIDLQ